MAIFVKKTDRNGNPRYRNVTENKQVSPESLDERVKTILDEVPEGTEVPESADIEVNEDSEVYDNEPSEDSRALASELVEVVLTRNLMINGVIYKAGKNRVLADVAEDLKRIDDEHTEYEKALLRGQDRSKNATQVRPQDVQ